MSVLNRPYIDYTHDSYQELQGAPMGSVDFSDIRATLEKEDALRNDIIIDSRKIVQLSKKMINDVHRGDLAAATQTSNELSALAGALHRKAQASPRLLQSGSYRVAIQEVVEAFCFLRFVKDDFLLTTKELVVDPELYLLGVADFTGEAMRFGINSVVKGNVADARRTAMMVARIYEEFMLFDFGNGELRKKLDAMKYSVQKLEQLMLDLKLKGI